jgi:hypothetical protein
VWGKGWGPRRSSQGARSGCSVGATGCAPVQTGERGAGCGKAKAQAGWSPTAIRSSSAALRLWTDANQCKLSNTCHQSGRTPEPHSGTKKTQTQGRTLHFAVRGDAGRCQQRCAQSTRASTHAGKAAAAAYPHLLPPPPTHTWAPVPPHGGKKTQRESPNTLPTPPPAPLMPHTLSWLRMDKM